MRSYGLLVVERKGSKTPSKPPSIPSETGVALPGGGHGTTLSTWEKASSNGRSLEVEPSSPTVALELIFGLSVANTVIPTGVL